MHKIIFFGTSEFAVPSLKALAADARFEIGAVVTRPDRPVGRHAVLTPPPVKTAALALGLSVIQPEKLSELDPRLTVHGSRLPPADVFVVVSYGKILPQWLLDLPKKGVINVHGSLLPRWRGASPIQAAIAAGDTMTGVTIMKMDAEMDHGPILAKAEEDILLDDTGGSLHDKLAGLGAALLPETLFAYLEGRLEPREQDHALATSCKILTRDDGKLDFSKTAQELERQIRAYNPRPGTWMDADDKRLKVLSSKIAAPAAGHVAGKLYSEGGRLLVSCTSGTELELERVQPEGGTQMSGGDFVRGYLNI